MKKLCSILCVTLFLLCFPITVFAVSDEVFSENGANKDYTVYITENGKKYHYGGCEYLTDSKKSTTLFDAILIGRTPCSSCKPPRLNIKYQSSVEEELENMASNNENEEEGNDMSNSEIIEFILEISSIIDIIVSIFIIIFVFQKIIFEKPRTMFESNDYSALSQSYDKPTKWHSFVLNLYSHYRMIQMIFLVLLVFVALPFITNMNFSEFLFAAVILILSGSYLYLYVNFLAAKVSLKSNGLNVLTQERAAKYSKWCAFFCFLPDVALMFSPIFTDYSIEDFDSEDFLMITLFLILFLLLGLINYFYFNKRMDFYDYSRVIYEDNNQYVAPAPVVNSVHVQQASAPILTPQPTTVKVERPQPTVQTAVPQPTVQPAKPQPVAQTVPQKPVAQTAAPQPVVHNDTSGRYSELYELKKLLDSGLITQEDYDKKKNQILNL